jgi:hypothetical protein
MVRAGRSKASQEGWREAQLVLEKTAEGREATKPISGAQVCGRGIRKQEIPELGFSLESELWAQCPHGKRRETHPTPDCGL